MRAKIPSSAPPAKAYIDDQEAYAANEVAINWNAPLVFLLAGALK
jgi:endoglucanase